MSPYNESVSIINTPFNEENNDQWDDGYYYLEPHVSMQKRMFLILAVVSMIVVGLSLFALPKSTGAFSAPTAPAAVQETLLEEVAVTETQTDPAAVIAATGGGISPIFTAEVRYWESDIIRWAAGQNLDPNIVATIMQIESCGDPQAVSIAGARGLFQVMPFHFSADEDMLDPDTNATRGLNFYNEQLRYTGNDKLLSFAGYNGGYAASGGDYAAWPDETKRYHTWAKGIYEDAQSGATQSATLDAWLAAGGAAGCQRAAAQLNIN